MFCRFCIVAVLLPFGISGTVTAQESKASVRIVNATEDERTVEINKFAVKIKAKSEEVVIVPPGEFTYKVVGIDTEEQRRTVKQGETWGMTIRATVTILPPEKEKEKELPPKVTKVEPKEWDRSKFARIIIKLPKEETTIWVDGKEMPKKATLSREFMTPELGGNPQSKWYYTITACWVDKQGIKRHVTRRAQFRCGDELCVDFTNIDFSTPVYGPIYSGPAIGGCSR